MCCLFGHKIGLIEDVTPSLQCGHLSYISARVICKRCGVIYMTIEKPSSISKTLIDQLYAQSTRSRKTPNA